MFGMSTLKQYVLQLNCGFMLSGSSEGPWDHSRRLEQYEFHVLKYCEALEVHATSESLTSASESLL